MSTMSDIEVLKIFAEQNGAFQITYSFEEDGPGHAQTFKYTYMMGDRIIGAGDELSNKSAAKASAAARARHTLRGEGYDVWLVHYTKNYAASILIILIQISTLPAFVRDSGYTTIHLSKPLLLL